MYDIALPLSFRSRELRVVVANHGRYQRSAVFFFRSARRRVRTPRPFPSLRDLGARARDPSARPGRSGRRFTKLQRSGRARKKNGFAGEARSARGAVRARNHTGAGPVRTTMSAQVASGMGSRMAKEVRALATSPPEGIKYVETDADQLTEIHAEISGPSTRARAATKKYERGRGGRTARGRPARARPQRERRTRAALSASSSCSGRTSPRRRRGASS